MTLLIDHRFQHWLQHEVANIQDIRAFAQKLQTAADFRGGATILLNELLTIVATAFDEAAFADAQVLRGMLHLRPEGSYRQLIVCEHGVIPTPDNVLRPSTTAWKLIEQLRTPLAIDVLAGRVNLVGPTSFFAESEFEDNPHVFDSVGTIKMLGERDTTHMLVLPLTDPQGSLRGMVSLELRSRHAIGDDLPWADLLPGIETLLIVGAPYVLSLPQKVEHTKPESALPVQSKWFADFVDLLIVFASQRETLLITGPTGSGKTYLARWIHDNSPQCKGPFIQAPLNEVGDETGLPHLFGWKKGAFTGALTNNEGWASQAEGGTLFLDEIDTLTKNQQQGVLRFLDTHRYTIMGGEERLLNRTRFIVATNADLVQLVAEGRFREDLYHRINAFSVDIPPLRERREEIPEWSQHFADLLRREWAIDHELALTNSAVSLISQHNWPGNLRELGATLKRACAYAQAQTNVKNGVLIIEDRHVETALDRARPSAACDPVSLLHRTAKALFDSTLRGDLDLYEPIIERKGLLFDMVWLVAIQELGDSSLGHGPQARNAVAKILGKEKSAKDGNYGRELIQALRRVSEFYGTYGCALPEEITRILDGR